MPAPDSTPAPSDSSRPANTPPVTGRARRYRRIYLTALICYWATAEAVATAVSEAAAIWLSGYGRLAVWLMTAALLGLAASQFDTQVADACARAWLRHRQDAR
jgi:hypothetical protein